jgi:Helix-turn-helix domain
MTTTLVDLGLVPPARLGPFVEMARRQLGMSREEVAAASTGRLSVQDLTLLERGRLVCREPHLGALQDLLGLPFAHVVPNRTRLIIDPMQGRLVIGGNVAEVLPDATDDELLVRYLSLVYLCRRARPGTYVVPRADDVETLADVLDSPTARIRQQLARLPYEQKDVLRLCVRNASGRRLLPGLGLFVGVHRRGALVMVDPETPTTELPANHLTFDPPGSQDNNGVVVPIGSARHPKK